MSSIEPPDAWEMSQGTWGIDIDRTEDPVRTRSGKFSIEFIDSGNVAKIRTLLHDFDLEHGNDPNPGFYDVTILWTADRASAGDLLRVFVLMFDEKGFQITAQPIGPGLITTPNTFEYHTARVASVSTVRQFRIELVRSDNLDFRIYVDSVTVRKVPVHFMATQDTVQSIPDNAWTTIANYNKGGPFNLVAGLNFDNTPNVAIIPYETSYVVNAMVTLAGLTDGQVLESRLNLDSGASFLRGSKITVGGSGEASVGIHKTTQFLQNTTAEFQVRQSGASASRNTVITDGATYFSIGRLI